MERLIIIHWDKSTGPIPIIQYPPEGVYPSKDVFLKIWAQHELNKENSLIELDFILEGKERSIISVTQEFKGEVYFLVLIIKTKSKVSDVISSDILAVITKNLLELINTDKITRTVSEAFNTIKNLSDQNKNDFIKFIMDIDSKEKRESGIAKENRNIKGNEFAEKITSIDLLIDNLIANIQKNPSKKRLYLRLFLERFRGLSDEDKNTIIQSFKDEDFSILKKILKKKSDEDDDDDYRFPYPYIFTHPRPPDDFTPATQVQVRAPLKEKDSEGVTYCQYCGLKLTKEDQFTHSCNKKPKSV